MPGGFLTQAEKDRLENFPNALSEADLTAFFTFTDPDLALIRRRAGASYQLGFALLLGTLRFLGFVPRALAAAPHEVLRYLAPQLHLSPEVRPHYQRRRTQQTQVQEICAYTGFRRSAKNDLAVLRQWLTQRALEHDKPTFLLSLAIEKLYREKILRPGLSVLARLVGQAREEAVNETYRQVLPTPLGDHHQSRSG